MKTIQSCNVPGMDDDFRTSVVSSPVDPFVARLMAVPVGHAIGLARQWLVGHQCEDGSWDGQPEGGATLNSEYVLLHAYLGNAHSDRIKQVAEYLIDRQLSDGGWPAHPTGKIDIDASVKAYFALKLVGTDQGTEHMYLARRAILNNGGADSVDIWTRFYLALLGQISYDHCPSIPPDVVLLPSWLSATMQSVDPWTRQLIFALSIVAARRPTRNIDPRFGIHELFVRPPSDWPTAVRFYGSDDKRGWASELLKGAMGLPKFCCRAGLFPFRRRAIRLIESLVIDQSVPIDIAGASITPTVWSIVALGCQESEEAKCKSDDLREHLECLVDEDDNGKTARLRPSKSTVSDTSLSIRALSDSGLNSASPTIRLAIGWLLAQQANSVDQKPIGLFSANGSSSYPNVKDTAAVLSALAAQFAEAESPVGFLPPDVRIVDESSKNLDSDGHVERLTEATSLIEAGTQWLIEAQNSDGGWGPFDRSYKGHSLLRRFFFDRGKKSNASFPDLTGRVLQTLGHLGHRLGDPTVDRAVAYLRSTQEASGSWAGRFGVNHIHGAWQAIAGLAQVGLPSSDLIVARGANWLLSCQNPSGGWGESPDSYDDPVMRGQGDSTASQTSWAILGLLAADMEHHPAVIRGIEYLINSQTSDGDWEESGFTGVGFPEKFYLRYHYYAVYFPLMALSRWATTAAASLAKVEPPTLRVVAPEDECGCHQAVGG